VYNIEVSLIVRDRDAKIAELGVVIEDMTRRNTKQVEALKIKLERLTEDNRELLMNIRDVNFEARKARGCYSTCPVFNKKVDTHDQ